MAPRRGESPVTWVADNQPSARYPVYTRGNVGEVFPTVVSPLTWTVYGVEAEAGWRDGFCKGFPPAPSSAGSPSIFPRLRRRAATASIVPGRR